MTDDEILSLNVLEAPGITRKVRPEELEHINLQFRLFSLAADGDPGEEFEGFEP